MNAEVPAFEVKSEVRLLMKLAVPMVATQLGVMLLGVVDMLVLGRVSVQALDAAALGNLWILGTSIVGMGAVMGISPIVSRAHGAMSGHTAGIALQRGVVIALLLSGPVAGSWLLTEEVMLLMGQDRALSALAESYVLVQAHSVPALLMYFALREYLQGRGIVWASVVSVAVANVVNAVLNWVLVFGHLGFSPQGIIGSGMATGISRWTLLLALAFWVAQRRLHHGAWVPWTLECLKASELLRVLRLGIPIGLQLAFEIWAFQFSTLLAGRLGEAELAAHTIVLNMASIAFMVPLGISLAAAARVGNLLGQNRHAAAQRSAWIALGLGTSVMLLSATVFLLLRGPLPRLYTESRDVLTLATSVLPIVACFQIFDGFQAVGSGILRGTGRTVPAAIINAVAYYGVALPLAWLLAIEQSLGLPGVWWGLSVGLAGVSVGLCAWIAKRGPAYLASMAKPGK